MHSMVRENLLEYTAAVGSVGHGYCGGHELECCTLKPVRKANGTLSLCVRVKNSSSVFGPSQEKLSTLEKSAQQYNV